MDKLNFNDLINPQVDEGITDNTDVIKLIAVNHLLSKDNLKTNTRIKQRQVSQLSKLYLYSDVFKIPFVKSLADNILELQISINGLGRKELVELVGKVYNPFDVTEPDSKGKKDIFR